MNVEGPKYIAYVACWILGPWIAGILLVFAAGLLRSLVFARHIGNELHFHLFGAYVVASRRMSFALFAVLLLGVLALGTLLSRRVVSLL
jgi:hypothetical protein